MNDKIRSVLAKRYIVDIIGKKFRDSIGMNDKIRSVLAKRYIVDIFGGIWSVVENKLVDLKKYGYDTRFLDFFFILAWSFEYLLA